MKLLWIDDVRDPADRRWKGLINHCFIGFDSTNIFWVKSYNECVEWININGLPDIVCFDHDLGDKSDDEKTGYDCCKYIVNYCQEHNRDIPRYIIQSTNPAGQQNIDSLMKNYHKFYRENKQ